MGTNDAENESRSDRYYAIGASYANGPLNLYFAVDSINYQTADANGALANASDIDDSLTITFGGNYDFEVLKLFAGAQYFDEIKLSKMGCGVGMMDVTEYNSVTGTVYALLRHPYAGGICRSSVLDLKSQALEPRFSLALHGRHGSESGW